MKFTSPNELPDLPDVAHEDKPVVQIPIQKVGVRNVSVPIRLKRRILDTKVRSFCQDTVYETVADMSAYVSLVPDMKGISMSPLTLIVNDKLDKVFTSLVMIDILREMKGKTEVNASDSYIKLRFRYPINKTSPKSGHVFPEFYDVEIEGVSKAENDYRFFWTVTVPYMSYCPCSAKLAKDLSEKEGVVGYPHAQRSTVKATVELVYDAIDRFTIEDLVLLLEGAINNCIPYPIIRRADEQELTRIAGDNLLFCEDAARLFADALEKNECIKDYVLVCNHFESIHTSEAVSVIRKNMPGGLQ